MSQTDQTATEKQVHGTCIAIDDVGVLIIGPSGSGKSDLALRLIENGAALVADDRVDLTIENKRVVARAPSPLRGLLEVRELGVLELESRQQAVVQAVIELQSGTPLARLPTEQSIKLAGVDVRCFQLDPWQSSAPIKARLASQLVSGSSTRIDD